MHIVVILIVVAIALVVVLGFFGIGGFSFFGSSQQAVGQNPAQAFLAQVQQNGGVNQLVGEDVTVGTGDAVAPGDTVTVNYTGLLTNGTVFDSSDSHGAPFTFTVGAGQVIQGWEQGLIGMKEGGTRLLAIPPSLGYGANAYGPIPANSTLIFQIQLVKRVPAGATSTPAATTPAATTPAQ
jgi:peptidylprolyl isomerase/FKBP-type peptidyl-prolyl cis-trans isomerase FkpA